MVLIPQNELAGYMGYLSIAFWLCAQLPQVLKNASLQSCEGLALPFLVNWLFGDITNFIGCVLTDQLPFQTYLAAYFCVIDFTLLVQFFHYKPAKPISPHPHVHHHHVLPHSAYSTFSPGVNPAASLHASLILPHRTSSRPGTSRTRSTSSPAVQPLTAASLYPHRDQPHPPHHEVAEEDAPPLTATSKRTSSTVRPRLQRASTTHGSSSTLLESPGLGFQTDGSYAALYEAALDVARVAERVNSRNFRRSQSRRRRLSRQQTATGDGCSDHEGDGGAGMMDSFHSEMSTWTRQTGTTSPGEAEDRRMTMSTPILGRRDSATAAGEGRGRSLRRNAGGLESALATSSTPSEMEDQAMPLATALTHTGHGHAGAAAAAGGDGGLFADVGQRKKRDKSRSLSLARGSSGRGGRRAAGVAFMSLGLIARGWFGTVSPSVPVWAGHHLAQPRPTGVVLAATASDAIHAPYRHLPVHSIPGTSAAVSVEPVELFFVPGDQERKPHVPLPDQPASYQRMIGRISAWCCTTLYLTSRLPQIWKNFKRRSVEGLSILLFLFAFCGNLFYVFSILLNPSGTADPADAGHYLLESLPYLLGSGGTLVFDLTIMMQAAIYGSAPPIPVQDETHKRLRLPGRRRWNSSRHLEDGSIATGVSVPADRGDRGDRGERAPLLLASQGGAVPQSRERSWSPDVTMRMAPGAAVPAEG